MNLDTAKSHFYDLAAKFWKEGHVVWTEDSGTKLPVPYLTLRADGMRKKPFPNVDSNLKQNFECTSAFYVNLYTKGKAVTKDGKKTGGYVNTAIDDLTDFVLYMQSPQVTEQLGMWNMAVSLKDDVQDLSQLENSTKYRYRAYAAFDVTFTLSATGIYNLGGSDMSENDSEGGIGLHDDTSDIINKAIITEKENS